MPPHNLAILQRLFKLRSFHSTHQFLDFFWQLWRRRCSLWRVKGRIGLYLHSQVDEPAIRRHWGCRLSGCCFFSALDWRDHGDASLESTTTHNEGMWGCEKYGGSARTRYAWIVAVSPASAPDCEFSEPPYPESWIEFLHNTYAGDIWSARQRTTYDGCCVVARHHQEGIEVIVASRYRPRTTGIIFDPKSITAVLATPAL